MNTLKEDGFEIVRGVFSKDEIEGFRKEANRVAMLEGSVCVRHLRNKSEMFNRLAVSKRILDLLPMKMIPVRSILFDKTAEANWPVAWHQDLTIALREKKEIDGYGPWSIKDGSVHVQPPESVLKRMVTARIHLDDTSVSNGALRVIPKSPMEGKIPATEINSTINESEVICECEAGDVLLMSPLILHASRRSEKPNKRRIVHFEYAALDCLDARLSWQEAQTGEHASF